MLPRARRWLRGHPWQADTLLALALFGLSAHQIPTGPPGVRLAAIAVSLLLAATVIPRRRYPAKAFAVAGVIGTLQLTFGISPNSTPPAAFFEPNVTDLVFAVLLYTLAAHRPRRISVTGLVICLFGVAVAIARWAPAHTAYAGGAIIGAAAGLGGAALTAWVLGDSVAYRYRRAYTVSLEDRAARLEAERDAQARIAAAAERARELQEQRARVVDEAAARLRRIERDLHDGAQVRLAALAMALGEIKESLDGSTGTGMLQAPGELAGDDADAGSDTGRLRMLVAAAHRNAKQTLAELRDLARGIHPPVLDRGLSAALASLVDTSQIPVGLTVSAAGRPSPAIEAIAYFCAAELLANAAKHSGASRVTITVADLAGAAESGDAGQPNGRLLMTVTDNGAGGARLAPGGGLAGLLERVCTVDGTLRVDSPPGGPTVITIELPGHA